MSKKSPRRKADMWTSSNKVLVGNSNKKQHSRNPNFETEETKLLISLWGDPKIQKTLITTHKKHPVIAQLAEKMRKHGYYRSPEEINTRIKNLKCFYNRIKKDVELGLIGEPTWKHYPSMDEILNRPIFGNRMQQQQQERRWREEFDQSDLTNESLRPEDLLKVEETAQQNVNEAPLVIPKEEPIDNEEAEVELALASAEDCDDDDEMDKSDVEDIFPKLSAYLKLTKNKTPVTNTAIAVKTAFQNPSSPDIQIKTSPPSTPPPLVSIPNNKAPPSQQKCSTSNSTSHGSVTSPANKISLVPTNILLKQQPATSQAPQMHSILSKKIQQHQQLQQQQSSSQKLTFNPQQLLSHHPNQFNLSQLSNHLSNGNTQSAVITSSAPGMPMKVLLVNTLSKQQQSAMTTTVNNTINTANLSMKRSAQPSSLAGMPPTQKTSILQPQSSSETSTVKVNAQSNEDSRNSSSTNFSMKHDEKATPGIRTLLNHLIAVQRETLGVSMERLDIERSRFDWEKSVVERLFNLPFFNTTEGHGSNANSNEHDSKNGSGDDGK